MRRSLEATCAFSVTWFLGSREQTLQALGLRIDAEAIEVQSSLGLVSGASCLLMLGLDIVRHKLFSEPQT